MSTEQKHRIHLANAALVTDPRIWPGTLIASHNTLGDLASELGVVIQAHPIRTLGTLVERINPARARIESGHQGFRGERYPWDVFDRNPKRRLVKTLVYALHHYGPPSLRHIHRYQYEMGQGPLPTTVYADNKTRADEGLGKQTIQLSRADARGLHSCFIRTHSTTN